jgi:nicotinic acid mononucleotide adenylyltransferase
MLRLYFHFDGKLLKVRQLQPLESFTHSVRWKNRIEFSLLDTTLYMMAWTSLLPDLEARDAEALLDLASARYPLSHDYQELASLCPQLVVGSDTSEWVFYGGSFNPWHEGHQACLSLLSQELTCFVLPDRNPHKEIHLSEAVPTIIELSYKARFGPHQFLVPTFLTLENANPTVDWIERLFSQHPQKKLSLLIGFDSFRNLTTWTRANTLILLLTRIYVAPRMEKDSERELIASELTKINSNLEIIFLDRHPFEKISSTDLRRQTNSWHHKE